MIELGQLHSRVESNFRVEIPGETERDFEIYRLNREMDQAGENQNVNENLANAVFSNFQTKLHKSGLSGNFVSISLFSFTVCSWVCVFRNFPSCMRITKSGFTFIRVTVIRNFARRF